MKALVVFYSLEGNTKLIAEMIAKELGADILELRPEKEIPKKGFMKFVWGGKSVIFKEKPKLLNPKIAVDDYDTLFIGTPVWAESFAPPLDTFITDTQIKDKKIAFFACHGGGGAENCLNALEKKLSDNIVIGKIDLKNPSQQDINAINHQVKTWVNSLTY